MNLERSTNEIGLSRELGLMAAISLIIGSTIGSGIFMTPQNLAANSTPIDSLFAWIITSAGSIIIALGFANLGAAFPKSGGCVVYTEKAFGKFAAFIVGWIYWLAQPCGVAALITASVSYLSFLFPKLATNNLLAFITSTIILWFIVLLNIRGVKKASDFQIITVFLKIIPIFIFIALALFHFNPKLISSINPEVKSTGTFSTLPSAIAITMWVFMGIESSTMTGDEIKNPEKNIRKSTIIGTIIVTVIYIAISLLSMGIMSQAQLAKSNAPIADMLSLMTGSSWWGIFVAIFVVISAIGCANGSTLTGARISYAIASDKVFPEFFAKVHKKFRTPYLSLLSIGVISNLLLFSNYVKGLNKAYMFTLLLTTMAYMVAYASTLLAEIALLKNKPGNITVSAYLKKSILPLIGFIYILYTIYGTGADSVMWGFILILAGIPLYIYTRLNKQSETSSYKTL